VDCVIRVKGKNSTMGSFDFEHCGHKQHFACFTCRKAYKARGTNGDSTDRAFNCPECKQTMTPMGFLFRAPRRRAIKAWKRLEELARSSPHPLFHSPQMRPIEGACPGCNSTTGQDKDRCPYCGYTRRAASGGRPNANAYQPGSQDS
jgi:hypothetical protein